jgi:peptidyl-prolyl cis-trans isomerase SurA
MAFALQGAMWRRMAGAFALAAICMPWMPMMRAQAPAAAPSGAASAPAAGIMLDRVIAVVNGDVILESDVDEERRFEEVQPFRSVQDSTRAKIIERLIDRELVLQQAMLEPEDQISDQALEKQIATVRTEITACKPYHCETDEGWAKFLSDHGFTVQEFRSRWRQRMQLLKFVEARFRSGISVSDDEIKAYYEKTMLPEYARRKAPPPPLDAIRRRIEEVLLQQQVGALLDDWLKSLRAQGSVQIMTQGEVAR